ncbi:MAG: hypothetical protein ACI4OL_03130 [Gemmiger sp.]
MNLEQAGLFIYRNARPLDLARWQYSMEGGSRSAVLTALAAYQNPDGGFGHGLEADCWNPHSSPVQTWAATGILREVGLDDPEHPIVRGILQYLEMTPDFDGHTWANTVASNGDYPHAPWWDYVPGGQPNYNPTASLTGFVLRFADPRSALYATALRLAGEATEFFRRNAPLESMHTAVCFAELLDAMQACGLATGSLQAQMQRQVQAVLTADTSLWATEYVCRPSLFIHSKASPYYPQNRALCEFECDFLTRTQQPDGSWAVTWDWGAYPEQWHISKNWWKSDLILKNVRFYKAMREETDER